MTKNNKGFLQVGLAILVASLALGIFLANKNKSLDVFAGACAAHPCGPGLECDGAGLCIPAGSGDNYKGPHIQPPKNPWKDSDGVSDQNDNGGCPNGTYRCQGSNFSFCLDASLGKTCNESAADQGYVVKVGSGSPGTYTGGWYCRIGINGYTGGTCLKGNSVDNKSYNKPPSCFCGTIQIDGGDYDGTYKSSCGCNNNHEPTPVPTPVKTPTPTPTRSPSPTPVCTPTPSHSPSPSPTPVPQCNSFCVSDSQCLTGSTCFWGRCRNPSCKTSNSCTCSSPTPSPSPRPSSTPSYSPSPSATPIAQGKLKICKFNDENGNGQIDNNEKSMSWYFIYKYQDSEHKVGSAWWNVFDHGCREVSVPANQWINVREEYKNEWSQTGVYQDGNWVGNSDYNYIAESNVLKSVAFLNHYEKSSTPAPTASGTPNWCNGTCGSNYNCQGGLFCYNGYCRNPNCSSDTSCGCGIIPTPTPTAPPVVLGATAPPQLPKTGADPLTLAVGLVGLSGTGFWIFKKFRLV